jgi:hypothetical protein
VREATTVLASSPARLEYAKALVDTNSALRHPDQQTESHHHLHRGVELAHICGATPLAQRGSRCSAEPLGQHVAEHAGPSLVHEDDTATVDVRIQFNVAVELGGYQVGEAARATVLQAAHVDHATVGSAGDLIVIHAPTVAPK